MDPPPLQDVSVVDFLESDSRPSFIIALPVSSEGHSVVYQNPALSSNAILAEAVSSLKDDDAGFWEWATELDAIAARSFSQHNFLWTRNVVKNKCIVVSANEHPSSESLRILSRLDSISREKASEIFRGQSSTPAPTRRNSERDDAPKLVRASTDPGFAFPGFAPEEEPFIDVINNIDWASTQVGVMERWPTRLQQIFTHLITDSRPMAIFWGAERTTIYNEAFSKLCGSRHPALLGKPAHDEKLRSIMRLVERRQRASIEEESSFFIEKAEGAPEEIWLKWSIVPIIEEKEVVGFMYPVLETTSMRLWDRRMEMLIALGEALVLSRDVKSYWATTLEELSACQPAYDIPMAILYSVDEDEEIAASPKYDCTKVCHLEGSLGVPDGHPIAPEVLYLRDSERGLAQSFRMALRRPHPFLVQVSDGSLPEELLEGLEWRGFGDPCRAAVICQIRPTRQEDVMGIFVLGLNPRRPYDSDYTKYISLLNQKLTTSLASTVLLQEEARRGRNAAAQAAYDQSILREALAFKTKEATEEASRRTQQAEHFQRMAEMATVGLCDMDLHGRLLSANDVFFEMCGLEKVDLSRVTVHPWKTCLLDEDESVVENAFKALARQSRVEHESVEIRLKTEWFAEGSEGERVTAPRWAQATFMPVLDSDNQMQSFTGCLIDVSLQKWQLGRERQWKEEALESKQQQDGFIDMTSHELRNPLSAIVHCADAITEPLRDLIDYRLHKDTDSPPLDEDQLIAGCIDKAETIVTSAQHQKRIVDDILTLSKLNSGLLAITPFTINPFEIVQEAFKMFEVEARQYKIELRTVVHQSFRDLNSDFLDFDPSRVRQILINLLTNALKFTKSQPTRTVTIYIKGSRTRPDEEPSDTDFVPRLMDKESDYLQPAVEALDGRAEKVYLVFDVQDTGPGLPAATRTNVFNRFVQASPRTHVKHGGSGLGLYISRRLTELQHGAIGVSSVLGIGSTFTFFIEARVPTEETKRKAADAKSGWSNKVGEGEKRYRPQEVGVDGILVVEDNEVNQRLTYEGLRYRGYKVDVANHGVEALEKLMQSVEISAKVATESLDVGTSSRLGGEKLAARSAPGVVPINLVLMDIEMPVLDGLACTRKIRELEDQGHIFPADGGRIPIIGVSANTRPEQVQQAIEAGCNDVVLKPYRIDDLIDKIKDVVGGVRRSAQVAREGGQPASGPVH